MSKLVKNMMIDDLKRKLTGVNDVLLVNCIGLNSEQTAKLRTDLRAKNIHLTVIKNSLARLATRGTPIENAFVETEGSLAVVWGGEDIVSLAKEIIEISEKKGFEKLIPRGGAVDGERLAPDGVKAVSTWPSRTEVLAKIAGQISGPGAQLAAQLIGIGGTLASQIKQKLEDLEKAEAPAAE
ncbi:MAG: 50S ribosomal protein L10 [Pirellulales bacterium]|nr:50S ribosomal protein L10 [Pirellulales bacterium]